MEIFKYSVNMQAQTLLGGTDTSTLQELEHSLHTLLKTASKSTGILVESLATCCLLLVTDFVQLIQRVPYQGSS
jgi:hypothetical protein